MAAYATVAQLRAYLDKIPQTATDASLQDVLDRACGAVDLVLGFRFFSAAETWPAASERGVRAEGSRWLRLPAYQQGSVSRISLGEVVVTGWAEAWDAGAFFVERDPDILTRQWDARRYLVTAVWGYGPAPAEVVQVNLELAVNLWQAKAAGRFSDVVGVEGGGAVGYAKALTNAQKQTLTLTRRRYVDALL